MNNYQSNVFISTTSYCIMDPSEDSSNTWRICEGEGRADSVYRSGLIGDSSSENIWTAAGDGDIERVLALLSEDPSKVNIQDDSGYSPL